MARLRRRSTREAPSRCCVVWCHARCFVLKSRPHLCAAKASVTNRSTCDRLGRRVFSFFDALRTSISELPLGMHASFFLRSACATVWLFLGEGRAASRTPAGSCVLVRAGSPPPDRGELLDSSHVALNGAMGSARTLLSSVRFAMHVWRVKEWSCLESSRFLLM